MARIVVENIPDSLRKKFKAACAMSGTTMRDALIEHMEEVVEEEAERDGKDEGHQSHDS